MKIKNIIKNIINMTQSVDTLSVFHVTDLPVVTNTKVANIYDVEWDATTGDASYTLITPLEAINTLQDLMYTADDDDEANDLNKWIEVLEDLPTGTFVALEG